MRAKTNPLSSQTRIFECLCCGSDKFHACEEDEGSFLSCANCGLRSKIRIIDVCNMVGTVAKTNCPVCGVVLCKCGKCHNCECEKKGDPI